MPRVLALIPDLLFGSRVHGALAAAGYEVELVGETGLLDGWLDGVSVLVVDLTNEDLDGSALVERLKGEEALGGTRTLGFYAHVDVHVRERAEQAGFDLIVPRSRMAREGADLVTRLLLSG
jgi:CheY-like chemotaxis protein